MTRTELKEQLRVALLYDLELESNNIDTVVDKIIEVVEEECILLDPKTRCSIED